MMPRLSVLIPILLTALILQGCATTPPDPATRILGTWESAVGGFTVTTAFTDADVRVGDAAPLGYTLEGNVLVIDGDPNVAREISFPSRDEMIQKDRLTGTEHRYRRVEG